MNLYSIPFLLRFRESLRLALRQCLVFLLFGAALGAVLYNSDFDRMGMQGNLLGAIFYLLFLGIIFGIPLWIAYRLLRFALGR